LKKETPTIAKIRMKRMQTIVTFIIEGREAKRAFTISFIPWFLEIILSGLKALRALNAFTDFKLEVKAPPSPPSGSCVAVEDLTITTKSIKDAATTIISRTFQGLLIYGSSFFSLRVLLLKKKAHGYDLDEGLDCKKHSETIVKVANEHDFFRLWVDIRVVNDEHDGADYNKGHNDYLKYFDRSDLFGFSGLFNVLRFAHR